MNSNVSPQVAAQELLYRRQARKSLPRFIEALGFGYKFAAHHLRLMQELEAVESGETTRLMIFMPPGSAKSTYASILFPPWFMGRSINASVLGVSNTTELAERFSRRVRNIIGGADFARIFGFGLSEDSAAAGNWETSAGGEFFAAGMGAAIAGRRADLGLIDDPIKTRQEADSDRVRQTHWEWYLNDFVTRLKPGARQILIQCMTGDTLVLMADGTEKPLRKVLVGNEVASYKDGHLCSATVLNWANQGSDNVYAIKTISGRLVKANERHPFLVHRSGALKWVRLRDLRPRDGMMRLKAPGKVSSAQQANAMNQQGVRDSATATITKTNGLKAIGRHPAIQTPIAGLISNTDTALRPSTMPTFSRSNKDCAPFANNPRRAITRGQGRDSTYASTTTIELERSEDCFATIAMLQSAASEPQTISKPPLNTYEFILDEIVSITPAGHEDVFDIQVERTENFIANGFAAHNTRWHEDDLGGRILEREASRWRIVKFPMLARENDPLGRVLGERLWPEWFTEEMIDTAKQDTRSWNALYQQEPVPDEGDYFKRDNFSEYDLLPANLHIYGASDFAVTEGAGDFTEHGVFGIDQQTNVYVLAWWRGQTQSDAWIEALCDLIVAHKPLVWFGEAGPIRRSIEPFLAKRMSERGAYCRFEWMPSIHDKVIRARAIQALASVKTIAWPKFSTWRAEVEKQMLQFPAGKYDDAVDVFSLIGRGLEHIRPAAKPAVRKVYDAVVGWQA